MLVSTKGFIRDAFESYGVSHSEEANLGYGAPPSGGADGVHGGSATGNDETAAEGTDNWAATIVPISANRTGTNYAARNASRNSGANTDQTNRPQHGLNTSGRSFASTSKTSTRSGFSGGSGSQIDPSLAGTSPATSSATSRLLDRDDADAALNNDNLNLESPNYEGYDSRKTSKDTQNSKQSDGNDGSGKRAENINKETGYNNSVDPDHLRSALDFFNVFPLMRNRRGRVENSDGWLQSASNLFTAADGDAQRASARSSAASVRSSATQNSNVRDSAISSRSQRRTTDQVFNSSTAPESTSQKNMRRSGAFTGRGSGVSSTSRARRSSISGPIEGAISGSRSQTQSPLKKSLSTTSIGDKAAPLKKSASGDLNTQNYLTAQQTKNAANNNSSSNLNNSNLNNADRSQSTDNLNTSSTNDYLLPEQPDHVGPVRLAIYGRFKSHAGNFCMEVDEQGWQNEKEEIRQREKVG